jgi:hypothetical protein
MFSILVAYFILSIVFLTESPWRFFFNGAVGGSVGFFTPKLYRWRMRREPKELKQWTEDDL